MDAIMRRKAVEHATGLPTSSLYDEMSKGRFPRPIKISDNRVGWLESEVQEWIEARIAERDPDDARWRSKIVERDNSPEAA